MLHAPTSPLVYSQVGACEMAFSNGFNSFDRTKQYDSAGENQGNFGKVASAEIEPEELTKQYDDALTKQYAKPRKRAAGTGDTDTSGKHSTRFKAYLKAVKNGKLTPSIYAFTRHEFQGKKIGSETAKIWLSEIEKLGVIERTVKNGKPAYALLNSKEVA